MVQRLTVAPSLVRSDAKERRQKEPRTAQACLSIRVDGSVLSDSLSSCLLYEVVMGDQGWDETLIEAGRYERW